MIDTRIVSHERRPAVSKGKAQVKVGSPRDRSYEAFVEWVSGLVSGLFGEDVPRGDEGEMRDAWKRYWGQRDSGVGSGKGKDVLQ